ncbi:hypothetical protein MHB54_00305 [Paenibacillus sp. FSL M7-0802]|uniref:hypothetical protein n=1 Tax=Paenibacillus sp. FSL M7-0802 TaxID=2921536 RepID=UPI0030F4D60E
MQEKDALINKKKELQQKIIEIDKKLTAIENLEKPYVANVCAYSGHYSMKFETEAKARKKLDEYFSKQYFKNGLNYGVYLYKYSEDGKPTLMDVKPKGQPDFFPMEFKSK